ncbi:serine/threonine-protein kinase [Nocardia sp. CS682]|uniref:serine/threonine-protein kinase n=1 Tax=Nocardia sp. CS682 TaxID=1047172 RepID=UPI001F0CE244|nr:serine/threonine-protein kinase [Nocardia sp. CS682]
MVQQLGVNESFADYLIEGVLGRGGMGTVYLAQHPRLPRQVALKLLNREVSADPELRRRFEQEANVVARLDHPGIVGIHDRGTHDGHLWIAMQYIHGSDAARLTPREVPIDRALRIVAETGAALDYAHSRGVLHRDIKPANILLAAPDTGRAERAVLTDFGIARLLDSNTQLTSSGTFHATLAYASPEQLSGEKVDHRSDQYSLACTLFTLLAGHPPFAATNPGQVVAGHISKPVPRLSAVRPDAPPMLDEVIFRAMAKRPEERFGSCREFTSAAWEARHGRPAPARTAVAPVRVAATAVNQQGQSQSPHGRDQSPRGQGQSTHGQGQSPHGQGQSTHGQAPHGQSQATATPVAAHTPAPMRAPQTDRRTPSGRGTALAACVLALLFGCWAAWVVAYPRAHVVRVVLRYRDLDIAPYAAGGAAAAGAAFLLIGGAVLLLARKRFGRAMVVLGSAGFLVSLVPVRFHYDSPDGTTGLSMVAGLVLLVLTLLLTLSTPTARWLRGGGSTHR